MCDWCNPYSEHDCYCQCHDEDAVEGYLKCDPVEMYD